MWPVRRTLSHSGNARRAPGVTHEAQGTTRWFPTACPVDPYRAADAAARRRRCSAAVVVAVGIVLIPFPGPGWLIVLAGLAILAIEFVWAQRLLLFTRARLETWWHWLGRQQHARPAGWSGSSACVFVGGVVWLSLELDAWRSVAPSDIWDIILPRVRYSNGTSRGASCRARSVPARARLPGCRRGGAIGYARGRPGRLAQRESASFTPKRSLVRSQYRPPSSEAMSHRRRWLLRLLGY